MSEPRVDNRGTLFVTGMLRSGTTLLEKLLCNHPRISILSQPSPYLFVEAKRCFLERLGERDPRYPLGDLFLEKRYTPEALAEFLRQYRVEPSTLRALFADMAGYSGQCTRFDPEELERVIDRLGDADLAATLALLYRAFAHNPEAELYGAKETLCEELLPYLLARGYRCLLIVRDPRDVIASLDHGRGREFGGRRKPTLFNVRSWRKSVAFALHLRSHPGFAWVRYEDLAADPLECLNGIAPRLAVAPFAAELFAEGIRDQSGQIWKGNSSHQSALQSISDSSVGRYRELLPASVVDFVEATCHPELRWLDYPTDRGWQELAGILRSYEEPYALERPELGEYVCNPARVAEELERLEGLRRPASEQTRALFLFADVHRTLRQVAC